VTDRDELERERALRLEIARRLAETGGSVWKDEHGETEVWDDGLSVWDEHLKRPGGAGAAAASANAAEKRERCRKLYLELRAEGHGKKRAKAMIVAEYGYSYSSVSRYVRGVQSMD